MRKELLGFLLIGGLAGCTSQWDTDRADAVRASAAAKAESEAMPARLVAERGTQRSLASLPDRGELLQYANDRKPKKSGAYTSHPVAISEAHALNAIAKGEMRINMPDGKTLDLKYDRYEEQPDGNWTWIGRNEDGSEAVLTFGDKAVFGMIASGTQSYGVRTDSAGAWIVETNQALLAAGGGHGRRKEGPDYLAPAASAGSTGISAVGIAAASNQKQAVVAEKAIVNEKAVAVVDVLLGYSPGIVASAGSESGAQTLMASRVALTNAAYQASGVSMRLRLVHAMLVNYSDTVGKNDATLRKLTGYDETTQQDVPVDPAFTALRNAREQYGADLVALVRSYREPEQDGCGIAWLIGMNQRAISATADARFGYAVVGDGTDVDESDSRTYKCSFYALAHELGHLMGQAHNTEDAAGRAGAHAYSYGYREAASTGFFTIMAYPRDDTQAVNEIGNFANPDVSVSGRATGVANASDNVRSMNLTMPIVSGFRDTLVPVTGGLTNDINADGRSDLLFRYGTTGGVAAYWLMNGVAISSASSGIPAPAGHEVAITGDFNGDSRMDVIWQRASDGNLVMWRGNSTGGFDTVGVGSIGSGWRVVSAGDINGDGLSDLMFRYGTNGGLAGYWLMNGAAIASASAAIPAPAGHEVAITGDFNGDGRLDVIWQRAADGNLVMWRGNSTGGFDTVGVGGIGAGWRIVAGADINGDGRGDLMFRYGTNGGLAAYWLMNGAAIQATSSALPAPAGHEVVATGDFNGDGRMDIIWQRAADGNLVMWRANITGGFDTLGVGSIGSGWRIIDTK